MRGRRKGSSLPRGCGDVTASERTPHVERADRRGQGIGSRIVQSLIDEASRLGKHAMIGGVEASNAASLRLHQSLGFEEVARFQQVGYKFDRWLDLIFLQRILA